MAASRGSTFSAHRTPQVVRATRDDIDDGPVVVRTTHYVAEQPASPILHRLPLIVTETPEADAALWRQDSLDSPEPPSPGNDTLPPDADDDTMSGVDVYHVSESDGEDVSHVSESDDEDVSHVSESDDENDVSQSDVVSHVSASSDEEEEDSVDHESSTTDKLVNPSRIVNRFQTEGSEPIPIDAYSFDVVQDVMRSWMSRAALQRARARFHKMTDAQEDPDVLIIEAIVFMNGQHAFDLQGRATPTMSAVVNGVPELIVLCTAGSGQELYDAHNSGDIVNHLVENHVKPMLPNFVYTLAEVFARSFRAPMPNSGLMFRDGPRKRWVVFENVSRGRPDRDFFVHPESPLDCMSLSEYIELPDTSQREVILAILQTLVALEVSGRVIGYTPQSLHPRAVAVRDFRFVQHTAYLVYCFEHHDQKYTMRMCPDAIPILLRHSRATIRFRNDKWDEKMAERAPFIQGTNASEFVLKLASGAKKHQSFLNPAMVVAQDMKTRGNSFRVSDVILGVYRYYATVLAGEDFELKYHGGTYEHLADHVIVLRNKPTL